MKKILWLVFAVLLFSAGGYFLFRILFQESESVRIKRSFSALERVVEKQGKEGLLVVAERVKEAGTFFGDSVRLDLKEIPNGTGVMNKQQIEANTLALRQYFDTMKFEFNDLKLEFNPDETECTAFFTAVFRGSARGNHSSVVKDLTAGLVKRDGQWKIVSLAIRDIITK